VLGALERELGRDAYARSTYPLAARIFERLMTAPNCPEWLTLAAYEHLD
jgi:hypothetical protein